MNASIKTYLLSLQYSSAHMSLALEYAVNNYFPSTFPVIISQLRERKAEGPLAPY